MKILKKIAILTFIFSLLVPFTYPNKAEAGVCYADPVTKLNAEAKIVSAVFLNDLPCMADKTVITTLSVGTTVKAIGWQDGWYAVEYNGARGWIGQQFAQLLDDNTEGDVYSYGEFVALYPSIKVNPQITKPSVASSSLLARVRGYILLQTESHGEAWYLDPQTSQRFYMKNGAVAYQMMRSFGLGVSEADYNKISQNNYSLKNRLRGRIILRAEAHGEAYYIHPKDLTVYYLQNGDEAYRIMRLYSLGITNADLAGINVGEIVIK